MRTKHAREIRKGLLTARNKVRGRREGDFEATIRSVVARNHLSNLGMKAYNRTWRKKWSRPLSPSDQHAISTLRGIIEEKEGN